MKRGFINTRGQVILGSQKGIRWLIAFVTSLDRRVGRFHRTGISSPLIRLVIIRDSLQAVCL